MVKQNWNELWRKVRDIYSLADKTRSVSVLDNFKNHKENICRRMGIVSDADVARLLSRVKPTVR
jgi:hypothetical protein